MNLSNTGGALLLSDLVQAHVGRPAFVLGGGPSLVDDFKKCQSNAVRLSANRHGCRFARCDYIVTNWTGGEYRRLYEGCAAPVIGPSREADYQIVSAIFKTSGMQAAHAALIMGCAPIFLGGMDCYQGADYWHSDARDPRTYGRREPPFIVRKLDKQIAEWRMFAEMDADIRACSGPLLSIFPAVE